MKYLPLPLLLCILLAACRPLAGTAEIVETSANVTPTVISGCGSGVITPEDAQCYLTSVDPAQVQHIDTETVVLLADQDSIADWAGAAIIYHVPTRSTLVLDQLGDVAPQATVFSSRAGLAALNIVAGDAELMAGLKQQIQSKWQTTAPNKPEIRLSAAWQDGNTTMFLIAVAGLDSTDPRFYCASELWTIGDDSFEIASDCIDHEAGTPVNHVLFIAQTIAERQTVPVQVALNGEPSNVVQVKAGEVALETAIYSAALAPHTGRPLIIRGETAAGFDQAADLLETAAAPDLRQNFVTANEVPFSLRFLFQDNSAYFVHPSESITRDYLQGAETPAACTQFRKEYPGLGGIITLSRIGFSDDGTQALVHVLHECGAADHSAVYYLLNRADDEWQISAEVVHNSPVPSPATESAVPSIGLGEPQTLGRGRIVDAVFTANGTGVAVAWANGVSFTAVEPTTEQWFQPLPAAPVALDMRADGEAVAAALADGSVAELALDDGRFDIYPVAHDNAYLGDVAYAPDGRRIAIQFIGPNRADPIYILDRASGTVSEVPDSDGNEGTEPYLVWSPDGAAITLASLTEACALVLDVQTGERLFGLQHPDGCYSSYAAAWSPDGQFLTLAGPNSSIDRIDFATQTVKQNLPGTMLSYQPSRAGQPLFYSPDGRWLASKGGFGIYGDSYTLQVWEAETGRQIGEMDLFRPSHRLVSSFADDSLLSLYTDGTLTRWSFTGPATDEEMAGQLPVNVVGYPFVWSPNGSKIAAANDNQFIVWDVAAARPQVMFDVIYEAPTFSADGRLVALTDRDTDEMIIYDLDHDMIVQTYADVTARGAGVAFAPDGRSLAYGSGNEVLIVDVGSGEITAVLSGYPVNQSITKIIWSPTGSALLAASGVTSGEDEPGTMILWQESDNLTGSPVGNVGAYRELFRAENVRSAYTINTRPTALFNPSGTLIALENLPRAEAGQFTIFVYDLQAEALILQFPGYQLSAWETDDLLLTSEEQFDTRLTQWRVRTGDSEVGQARDNGGLTFAPTGGFNAQATMTGAAIGRGIELRHWQSNEVLAQVPLDSDVLQTEWSRDGRLLAASAADGTVTIWPVIQRGS